MSESWDTATLDVEAVLDQLLDLVASAKAVPLSSSVLVAREELVELLDEAKARLPEEIRRARWLLREREEFRQQALREGEEIVAAARTQAEQMVSRMDLVREAHREAERLVEEATREARRIRHEAEDYCDQKLAGFEAVLDRLARTVVAGRARLAATPPMSEDRPIVDVPGQLSADDVLGELFDQDRT